MKSFSLQSLRVFALLHTVCASDVADWRNFAAGGLAAAISHGYTTPIDVVKTRMQSNPEQYKGASVVGATKQIIKEEGVGFLAQGLAPTVAGYGVEGALKFGVYEILKPAFAELTPNKLFNYVCASVVAGAIASIVLCPAEEVRIRLVSDPSFADSSFGALQKLTHENGMLASFSGFPAMCAKQIPYTMGKQVSFDICCQGVRKLLNLWLKDEGSLAFAQRFVPSAAALPAACLACLLSHPGDMVLTEYYKNSRNSVLATVKRLVKEGGLAALFRGFKARLVHVISIIWVQLIMYDELKQALGLASTGH